MKEYISKDYIHSILRRLLKDSRGAEHYAYKCVQIEIDGAPDSEIIFMYKCSICGEEVDMSSGHFTFCPCCGHPMIVE